MLGDDERFDISDHGRAEALVDAFLRGDEDIVSQRHGVSRMVFMSHKTGDAAAETEARYISSRHNVAVYMAEWDSNIPNPAYVGLPSYIKRVIKASVGFLVHVIDQIKHSMWVGYEVGVAHTFGRPRAKITFNVKPVPALPAVVGALKPLKNRAKLGSWIQALPPLAMKHPTPRKIP